MSLVLVDVVSEDLSADNPSAELLYLCDTSERWYYMQLAVGVYSGAIVAPWYYPYYPMLQCVGASAKHVGGQGQFGLYTADGEFPNGACYLSLTYGPPTTPDPQNPTTITDICEVSCNLSGSAISLTSSNYKWLTSGVTLDDKVQIQKIFPECSFSIKYPWATSWNIDTISDYVGRVNSTTMTDGDSNYSAEKCLYLGFSGSSKLSGDTILIEKTHAFQVCQTGKTWNSIMKEDGTYDKIITTVGGKYLYDKVNLEGVITL